LKQVRGYIEVIPTAVAASQQKKKTLKKGPNVLSQAADKH